MLRSTLTNLQDTIAEEVVGALRPELTEAERALAIDPDYALARAGGASASAWLFRRETASAPISKPPARSNTSAPRPPRRASSQTRLCCHSRNNKSMGGSIRVASHLDALVKYPTVWFDDRKTMEAGRLLVVE